MCTEMYCPETGQAVTTIGDLLAFMPQADIVMWDEYPPISDIGRSCLCPVNWMASFERSQTWKIDPDESMPGDWIITRRHVSEKEG